jgi:Uncharacterized protein conserved in bacteria
MQKNERTIDPHLLRAIVRTTGRVPLIPYDLKKIKELAIYERCRMPSYETISFFRFKEHDFSVLGEMENLHTLRMYTYNPLIIADFSFLKKCRKMKKLDLAQTNFTDCALLSYLPELVYVHLPEEKNLINKHVLDTIHAKIEFDEEEIHDYPIVEIVEQIKEKTKRPAYALALRKGIVPDLFDSKFGGLPYWNPKMAYPLDRTGQKMTMIAQINFDRATVDERLPQQGILQFFIALDDEEDLYGYDGEVPDRQEMFRVVYHEAVDYGITKEQVLKLEIPICTDPELRQCSPVWNEIGFDFVPQEVYLYPDDKHIVDPLREAEIALIGKDVRERYFFNREEVDYFYRKLSYFGSHMLGYPLRLLFTPQKIVNKIEKYDTVLLQIHQEIKEQADRVLWSHSGAIQFFMNSEALARRDFSKVLYYWGCVNKEKYPK